ncbi:hypothetical protein DPMN_167298 [Dreissena polymorpha]|uniref:3-oxoacyl-[acyl-carrier-protein] reductase n=1 Tax=Dreissena polymorpha TaxID=45954 RepID=A0A9D4IYG0_DREPO|nr:hypothetical protein DPMN_167298 [Dreissena polymorpha]
MFDEELRGFNSVHAVESYPVATWHKMMAVHLTAPFLLSKFFVPYMKKKARFVRSQLLEKSTDGFVSAPGKAPCSVAKSGLIAFAKGLALEVAEHGITCNAIFQGSVETDCNVFKDQIEAIARENNVPFEQARVRDD